MADDDKSTFQGHPFYVAIAMFNAAVQTPLDIAAAFWRPWFKARVTQEPENQPVKISLPKTENQVATAELATVAEDVSRRTKRKQRAPKPPMKKVVEEKKPKAPIKHTLKEKLELEREERTQKTERLRKLRQEKEAASGRKRPISNGHSGSLTK